MNIVLENLVVILGISVFLLVIFLLVTIILIAEKKLVPQGNVKILINGDESKSPTVKPGGTLLSALSAQSIFIISVVILSHETILILSIFCLIPSMVVLSKLKSRVVEKRIALSILNGSSLKVISGSLGVINIPLLRSEIPLRGS